LILKEDLCNSYLNRLELFLETGLPPKHNALIPYFLRIEPMTALANLIEKLATVKLSTLFFLCTTVALGVVGLALYVVILALRAKGAA
jgi:hypothetical protein